MAELPHLPLFVESWEADTAHLARAERGLYMDLLVLMWKSPGCHVPDDINWIARRLRCTIDERKTLEMIIAEFCRRKGGFIDQKRLTKEYNYVIERREKRQGAANSRWNKKKLPEALDMQSGSNADAKQMQNTSNADAPIHIPIHIPINRQLETPSELFARVDAALRAIPEVAKHPIAADVVIAPIVKLVEQGTDLTLVVQSITSQLRKGKRQIGSWRYFVKGITEAAAAATTLPAASRPEAKTKPDWSKWDHEGYVTAVWAAKHAGHWPSSYGPHDRIPSDLVDDELRTILSIS